MQYGFTIVELYHFNYICIYINICAISQSVCVSRLSVTFPYEMVGFEMFWRTKKLRIKVWRLKLIWISCYRRTDQLTLCTLAFFWANVGPLTLVTFILLTPLLLLLLTGGGWQVLKKMADSSSIILSNLARSSTRILMRK